jgi:hypothetical protein
MDIKEIKKQLTTDPISTIHMRDLKKSDMEFIDQFLDRTSHHDPNDRQLLINRLFMDNPNKPKNWLLIMEFLQFINSRHYRIWRSK